MEIQEITTAIEKELVKINTALRKIAGHMMALQNGGELPLTTPTEAVPVKPEVRKPGRASRLPADWQPRPDDLAWAIKSFPNVEFPYETDKFRDYWIGSGGTKINWDACFRNWARTAAKYNASRPIPFKGGSAGRTADLAAGNRAKAGRLLDKLSQIQQGPDGPEVEGDWRAAAD